MTDDGHQGVYMGVEIERRFLIQNKSPAHLYVGATGAGGIDIVQCYPPLDIWLNIWPSGIDEIDALLHDSKTTFRLRIKGNQAYATVKGAADGATRIEFEEEVDYNEVSLIINSNKYPFVVKKRYVLPAEGGLNWEIDCFEGDNSGLIIVEIEIPTPDYPLMIPTWLGKEVTEDGGNWSNYALALNPLSNRT